MPEGDTIQGAARRIRNALVGKEIASIETPHPRYGRERWQERLSGRAVRAVDSRGKHLFIRFEGDLTVHSHLRMTGWWGVYERGRRWGKSPSRAWLVIRTAEHEVVQFGGPVLELMTDSRSRFDHRIARLGPDILADEFDDVAFLRRLREDDQTRPIGDALLDQRNLCGIGNLWRAEACFLAGLDPWRPLGALSDEHALAAVHSVRPLMQRSARGGGHTRESWVFERHGRPCRRCGTTIRARGQGDDNRTVYWCPACQA
jgi:endonuclease-8